MISTQELQGIASVDMGEIVTQYCQFFDLDPDKAISVSGPLLKTKEMAEELLVHRAHENKPSMILDALQYAIEKHGKQTRRGSSLPYITHPIAVSALVAFFKDSSKLEELIVASILHDVIEDTDATRQEIAERFTPLVASIVEELSSDADIIRKIGKREYIKWKLMELTNYALVIKLCDRLHNISDSPSDKMIDDTLYAIDFLLENRKLTKPQQQIANLIQQKCIDYIKKDI